MRAQSIKLFIGVTGMCMALAGSAQAADIKPYAEIGLSNTNADNIGDHISGVIRGGVELTSWLAVEGEAIVGLEDSVRESRGDTSSFGLDSQFGGYLRLGVPIKKRVLPYIRLGVGTAQISDDFVRPGEFSFKDEDSFTAPSLGIGIQGFFGKARENGIRLDLTGLSTISLSDDEDEDDFSTGNVSLTYVRRF